MAYPSQVVDALYPEPPLAEQEVTAPPLTVAVTVPPLPICE